MIINESIKAVIFDLDGTLLDSMWIWKQIDIDYLSKFGLELPPDLQTAIEGMSFSETAVYIKNRFNIPDSLDKMKSDWNEMAEDFYRHKVKMKDGAEEFLLELKNRGIKTGIATSNSMELLSAALDGIGIRKFFDAPHVSCEVNKGKPAPDIYLLVAEDLSVPPENCLVFEDITQGIEAGHAAGMKVCGVQDEFADIHGHKIEELADYYIRSYKEIEFYDGKI